MTLALTTPAVLLTPTIVLIALWALVRLQITALRRRSTLPLEWTPVLCVDRYRPMFRLLDDDDVRFLRSQPGATPAMVKRLRRQRCQVFRGYLRSLERDFALVYEALMLIMVHSQSDRRDLIRTILVSRLKFTIAIYRVRCRLFLYRWDVGHESVANILGLFEGLQLELLALAPTPDGAGV